MTVATGQAGEDETPNVVETLVNELCAVRAELATALGDLYEQGEDLVKARNQVAYRDRKITELTAERDETWKELNRQQAARIGEAATRARLAGERDRARDIAVALEQECLELENPYGLPDEDERARLRRFAEPGGLDLIFAEAGRQELAERTIRATVEGTVTLNGPPLSDAFITAARGTIGDPGRHTSFLEAHEYDNPAVREATEELARETVRNEWARRGLTLGGLLTEWDARPLVGRPNGWTFTVWGTPATDVEHTDG